MSGSDAKGNLIQRARKTNNYRYKYNYKLSTVNDIAAKCAWHGNFKVDAHVHAFRGIGCPHCSHGVMPAYSTLEKHVEKSKELKDIKLIKPTRWSPNGRIGIHCKHHGKSTVAPFNLMWDKGCADCARGIRSNKQYIKEAKKVHKGKDFDYSLIPDGNVHGDVKIGCPVHGVFTVHSLAHIQGTACRSCTYNDSKYFYIYMFLVYNKKTKKGFYKLGLAKSVESREKQLRRALAKGYEIKLLESAKFKNLYGAFKCEYWFLDKFPGKPLTDKKILSEGHTETKLNGMPIKKARSFFLALERRYRRTYKTYHPRRQLWNTEQMMAGKKSKKRHDRFKFKKK